MGTDWYDNIGLSMSQILVNSKLADTPGTAANDLETSVVLLLKKYSDEYVNKQDQVLGYLPNTGLVYLFTKYHECNLDTQKNLVKAWVRALDLVNKYNNPLYYDP